MAKATNQGRCLCGQISWQISAPPFMMSNCHCGMCRKFHGSAFATYVGVMADEFEWLTGKETVQTYESSPGGLRPFCPTCGSIVASSSRDGTMCFMPAGNLDGNIERDLDHHTFTGSRAVWHEITDSAQCFDAYPPDTAEGVEQPERPADTPGAAGGSCLRGDVAYGFDETLRMMGYCHCSRCRRSRSSASSTQVFVAIDNFRWRKGENALTDYKLPESEFFISSFCRRCASLMPTIHPDRGIVMVPAGSLDQDPGIRPTAHIHRASKATWFTITDDLLQFDAMPPGAPT
jgi:hypothetical protein